MHKCILHNFLRDSCPDSRFCCQTGSGQVKLFWSSAPLILRFSACGGVFCSSFAGQLPSLTFLLAHRLWARRSSYISLPRMKPAARVLMRQARPPSAWPSYATPCSRCLLSQYCTFSEGTSILSGSLSRMRPSGCVLCPAYHILNKRHLHSHQACCPPNTQPYKWQLC